MAIIGNLAVSVTAKTDKFTKGMKSASRSLSGFAKDIASIGLKTATFGAGLAAAAGGGLAALIKSTANAGDKMDKMSKRTGLAVDFLSKLDHAAGLSGTNIDVMEGAMRKMTQAASDANFGLVTYKREFDRLGVSITDSGGKMKSVEDIFMETVTALSQMESSTLKVSTASKIFGRAGTQLLPMLTQGKAGLIAMMKEAEKLGFVWSGKTAGAAAELNDNLLRLTTQIKGAATEFAVALMPEVTNIIDGMSKWLLKNKELISSKLVDWAGKVGGAIRAVYDKMIEWSENKTFELWIARAKAGWLGLKAVGVGIWEAIKFAGNMAIFGIAKGLDLLVKGFKFSIGHIQKLVASFAEGLGNHFAGVPGMDKMGRRILEFAGSTRVKGQANILDSEKKTDFGKYADLVMGDADENVRKTREATMEYIKAAENVAYLQEMVSKKTKKNIEPMIDAAEKIEDVSAGRNVSLTPNAIAGPGQAKYEDQRIGFGKEINTALMSVYGLNSGTKKQKVEDPQLKETNNYLKQIAEGIVGTTGATVG